MSELTGRKIKRDCTYRNDKGCDHEKQMRSNGGVCTAIAKCKQSYQTDREQRSACARFLNNIRH